MHLTLLSSILSLMFLQSDGGAGSGSGGGGAVAGGDGSSTGDGTGDGADKGGTPAADTQNPATSANKLIKDYAAKQGMTVEALLSKLEADDNAGKTALEKLTTERDSFKTKAEQTESQLRSERADRAILSAATRDRAVDPDAILALAKGRLEFDADGKPKNVDDVLKALRTERPERFKAAEGSTDASVDGSTPPAKGDMNKIIARQLFGQKRPG